MPATAKPNYKNPRDKVKRLHTKTLDKILISLRLQVQNLGLPDSAIARHLGMSPSSYSLLKRTKMYQQLHSQYMSNVLAPMDNDIQLTYNHQRRILESGVPTALENLVRLASQKLDNKLALEASKELLDRHGMHAKVSRTGFALQEQGGAASLEDNNVAQELLKALNNQKKENDFKAEEPPNPNIEDAPASSTIQ